MRLKHVAKAINNCVHMGSSIKKISCISFFQSPLLLLPYLDNFACFAGNGMIEAMLEPHLKAEAGGTQLDVDMTFLVLGGCYTLTTPIWGYVNMHIAY